MQLSVREFLSCILEGKRAKVSETPDLAEYLPPCPITSYTGKCYTG